MSKSQLTFVTGVQTVTGAHFLLHTPDGAKIAIDCGMVQGSKVATEENREPFPYDISLVSALCITHAHLDHVGRIPLYVKLGYSSPIYSTPETKKLAEIVLRDAVTILAMEAGGEGREPLYVAEDVERIFGQWETIPYHESKEIAPNVSMLFKDAGHILGSSMIEFTIRNSNDSNEVEKILFTGDLGNSPSPLLRDTEIVGDANCLIMESVYGDRNHENREGRENKFRKIVNEAIDRGGTLVIPAFAIDRSQILLFELNNLVEKNLIPRIPIFVDSPMATKATQVYRESTHLFNDKIRAQIDSGDDIFSFSRLEYTVSKNESQEIDRVKGAKIVMAGSGMSIGGRVVGHERRYLEDPGSTILLVGYQAAGSLGRELADGAKKVKIGRETVKVKATIETMYDFSAHKDSDHLVEFVSTGTEKLKKIFVVMGEPRASMHLAQRLNDELGVRALVPEVGQEYEI